MVYSIIFEGETHNKEDGTKSLLEIIIICSSCYQQFSHLEMHSFPLDQFFYEFVKQTQRFLKWSSALLYFIQSVCSQ